MMNIGIYGFGNMGRAIALAFLKKGNKVIAYDKDPSKEEKALKEGIGFAKSPSFLKELSEIIVLSIKPKDLESLNESFENQKVVSILAGSPLKKIKELTKAKVAARIMANLGIEFLSSPIAIYCDEEKDLNYFTSIFEQIGNVYPMEEEMINAFTAIAGSGPAFFAEILEGAVLSGVYMGFNYDMSLSLCLDTMESLIKLSREKNLKPSEIVKMVSSPKGTTIEGILEIEKKSVKGNFMSAFIKAFEKSKNM